MTILDLSEFGNFPQPDQTASDGYSTRQLLLFRLLMGLGLIATTLWLGVVAMATLLTLLCARRWLSPVWHNACFTAACTTACFVGLFSVRFGVTILCIYMLIHPEEGGGAIPAMIRSHAQRVFHRL